MSRQVRVGTRRVSVSEETYATLEAWSELTAARLGHKPSVDGAATALAQVLAPGINVLQLTRQKLSDLADTLATLATQQLKTERIAMTRSINSTTREIYIDALSGDLLDNEQDIERIAYDAERRLNRENWYTAEEAEDVLYSEDPLNQYGDRLWALVDDGGSDGPRWLPVTQATHRIAVDYENNSEAWWNNARKNALAAPQALRSLLRVGGPDEVFVDEETMHSCIAWCETVAGWNKGDDHGGHPLVWRETEPEDIA